MSYFDADEFFHANVGLEQPPEYLDTVEFFHANVGFDLTGLTKEAVFYFQQNIGFEIQQIKDAVFYFQQNIGLFGPVSAIGRAYGFSAPMLFAYFYFMANILEQMSGSVRTVEGGATRTVEGGEERIIG